jgi:hypothetical protein
VSTITEQRNELLSQVTAKDVRDIMSNVEAGEDSFRNVLEAWQNTMTHYNKEDQVKIGLLCAGFDTGVIYTLRKLKEGK